MKKIILASNNKHKIEEIKDLLKGYKIYSLADINFQEDIEETAETFEGNALLKAKAILNFAKNLDYDYILADDSGLCVEALGGAPGVYSARYAGEHDDEANRQKLLDKLQNKSNRFAQFVCCLCLMEKNGNYQFFVGKTDGEILKEYRGDTSFCYDCLFFSKDLQKTFGEASSVEKNSVSHRARALEQLKEKLYFTNKEQVN